MKISMQVLTTSVLAAFTVVPGATASFQLRSRAVQDENTMIQKKPPTPSDDDDTDGIYVGAIITMDHLIAVEGEEDSGWKESDMIEALVKADSKVNSKSEYSVKSGFVEKSAIIPEDGNMCLPNNKTKEGDFVSYPGQLFYYNTYSKTWIFLGCSRFFSCRRNNADSTTLGTEKMTALDMFLEVKKGRSPEHHKALEADFCKILRNSGNPAYKSVTGCSISYTVADDDDDTAMIHAAPTQVKDSPFFVSGTKPAAELQ